jgi:hypothetical protein
MVVSSIILRLIEIKLNFMPVGSKSYQQFIRQSRIFTVDYNNPIPSPHDNALPEIQVYPPAHPSQNTAESSDLPLLSLKL